MKRIFKKPIFYIGLVILILLTVVVLPKKSVKKNTTVDVQRGTIIQEVSVTGRVRPAEEVDLSLEKSGKVAYLGANVGDRVISGQILLKLNSNDLMAQLAQYQAALDNQKAKLEEIKKGSRPEEISIKQLELQKASQDLDNYYDGISDILYDAYNKADDALSKQVDAMFTDDLTNNPQISFTSNNFQAELNAERGRYGSGIANIEIKDKINNLSSDHLALNEAINYTEDRLIIIRSFLIELMNTVNSAIGLTQTTIDSYRANITTAQTNLNTAISNINTKRQNIASQKLTVERIKRELDLKLAGYTTEQIVAQEALVKQAEANISNIQAQLEKNVLRSPINGIVTKIDIKLGELASANVNIASVISEARFEIESNIAEVDIANIKAGNMAKVTLDAYGNEIIFEATVVKIDPGEIIIDGVATYKTTLQFNQDDEKIKSGMTANIDIIANKKENTLFVPQRAIVAKDGKKYVQIIDQDNNIRDISIEVGLKGSDGNIEILNGVQEGVKVLMQ